MIVEEKCTALDIDILGFHRFHDKILLGFFLRHKTFYFARGKRGTCHGEEFDFVHRFQLHGFVASPFRIAIDGERKRTEQMGKLFDVGAVGRSNDDELGPCLFNILMSLTQLRQVIPADRSAEMTDENDKCSGVPGDEAFK